MKIALAAKDGSFTFERTRLEELESKVALLEGTVQQQQSIIVALQNQINERPANSHLSQFDIHPSSDGGNRTAVAATGMPQSCADLQYMGHAASGLYLIMGTDKVETVYCDFTALPSDPSKIILCELQFN